MGTGGDMQKSTEPKSHNMNGQSSKDTVLRLRMWILQERRKMLATNNDWTVQQTTALLDAITEHFDELKSSANKAKVWKKICTELQKHVPHISVHKCKDKWKNLKKSYRNHVQQTNRTGAQPSKCKFADQMFEMMGDDPSVVPVYVASSDAAAIESTLDDSTQSSVVEADEELNEQGRKRKSASNDNIKKTKKRKASASSNIITYMQEHDDKVLAQLAKMHNKTIAVMNKITDKL
ncbi:PREDICTED: uncharacterized protein LOC106821050 isoform X2 [Priapulus caudatus]|uniref:Uncharacterized protein LOC106821050 isoform X2 n=1 Tax=Priapulus caudatus TaxID=37621 RepID=A0ABM1F9Q6_PRICU|nr:PREDICTED: uncharacterized protein LOC106821050 isoform X2 [Priapulus caudatus]